MLKFFEKRKYLSLSITVIIAIIIFTISSMSFKGAAKIGIISVIYHFLAFFWFSFFLVITLIGGKRKKLIYIAIILAIIYAVSDEIHQIFVPYRVFSVFDILTDAAGVLFASFIYLLSIRKSSHL
jgi:hypothetical protein